MTVGDGCKVGISKIQTSQVGMFCTFMVIPVCQLTAPGEIEIFEGVHYSKVLWHYFSCVELCYGMWQGY